MRKKKVRYEWEETEKEATKKPNRNCWMGDPEKHIILCVCERERERERERETERG